MDSTAVILGIMGLAAVWLWSSAKVSTAAINSNLFTPQGLNAAGNAVGAGLTGISSILAAANPPTGSNYGGGPLSGQGAGSGNPSVFTPTADYTNLLNVPNLNPGGPDGGDTTSFTPSAGSDPFGLGNLSLSGSGDGT
jgi:hypothetical protein